MEKISQIDEQILALIDDPIELEQTVLDGEEIRYTICIRSQDFKEFKTTL